MIPDVTASQYDVEAAMCRILMSYNLSAHFLKADKSLVTNLT